jgi:hypothetical protein
MQQRVAVEHAFALSEQLLASVDQGLQCHYPPYSAAASLRVLPERGGCLELTLGDEGGVNAI